VSPVHFRPITAANPSACLRLQLDDAQRDWIAPNATSLAQAYVNPLLQPYAVYEHGSLGFEQPVTPMVGFVVLEVSAGVGFLLRLMIDRTVQGNGLGRATLREVIRRLRLDPEVQVIATSHWKGNQAMARLLEAEGFVPWDIAYAHDDPDERFLYLPS
jgi:diamine N-acetyltransferase